MKEASVRARPDTNHFQFPGEAVRALPPVGSKALGTPPRSMFQDQGVRTQLEKELPYRHALLLGGETHNTDAQTRQRCSGLPQSQPRQHVPPEEEVVCSKRNKTRR